MPKLISYALLALIVGCSTPTKDDSPTYPAEIVLPRDHPIFPAYVAGFERGRSLAYAPEMSDFSTAYNLFNRQNHISATMYIFSESGSFEAVFAADHDYISSSYPETVVLGTWEMQLHRNGTGVKAYRADYMFQTNFMGQMQDVFSQYLLWRHKDKFVKLRITSPFSEMKVTQVKSLELIDAVKWDF